MDPDGLAEAATGAAEVAMENSGMLEQAIREGWATLAVLILFCGVLMAVLRMAQTERKSVLLTQEKLASTSADALGENSKAVTKLGNGLNLLGVRLAAQTEVIRAQPAAYALAKHRAANGDPFSPEELEDLRTQVRKAKETADELVSWPLSENSEPG